jgi:hypothetical protein
MIQATGTSSDGSNRTLYISRPFPVGTVSLPPPDPIDSPNPSAPPEHRSLAEQLAPQQDRAAEGRQRAARRRGGGAGTRAPSRQIRLRVVATQAPNAGADQIRRSDGVDDGAAPGPAPLRRPPRCLGPLDAAARRRLPRLPGHRRRRHRHPRRR